jgi:hypothetical protein
MDKRNEWMSKREMPDADPRLDISPDISDAHLA